MSNLKLDLRWEAGPAIGGEPRTVPGQAYLLLVKATEQERGLAWWEFVNATVDEHGELCDPAGGVLSYTWGDISWVAPLEHLLLPPVSA